MSSTDDLPLIDHHCHGLLPTNPTPDEFRLLGTESDWLSPPGVETLDTPFGLGIRRICAPLLDLPRHAPIDDYIARRIELGPAEVHARLMPATGTGHYLIDSGFVASPVMTPAQMSETLGKPASEVVRLERVAEQVAPSTTAAGFVQAFRAALAAEAPGAVGFKSVIAYRWGFDIDPVRPTEAEVTAAAGEWFAEAERTGSYRVSHPIVLQHLIWEAIPFGKPIQFHTGFGDSDLQLYLADPSRLTKFFVATRESGVSFTLLHCYPFIREAAVQAHIFPHVYVDVGVITHYLGPSAGVAIRHSMEIAPFGKILYSSDAYGLAEHYLVSASAWRRETGRLLDSWLADDWLTAADAERIAWQIGIGNAARIYGIEAPA
jgi:predicted TIM-barrel fold metal-dependent hydrolase